MKKATYTFVHNRNNKLSKQGKAAVKLQIYAGWRKFISTGIFVAPAFWDDKNRRVSNKHPMHISYNKILTDFQAKYEMLEFDLINRGLPFTAKSVDEHLQRKSTNFIEFCKWMNLNEGGITYDSKRARSTGIACIEKSGFFNSFDDLTLQNVKRFDEWLRHEKQGFKPATIAKRHHYLRAFINKAIPDYLDRNPYDFYTIKTNKNQEEPIRYLEHDELQRIEDLRIFNDEKEKWRDFFLFQCYTSVAYSDLFTLTHADIHTDHEKEKWIVSNREKTNNRYHVLLSKKALQLVEKYRDNDRPTLFPALSNQKYNDGLKTISNLASVQKITTHMARHTFAVHYLERNPGDIETLARIMGHASVASTRIYAKATKTGIKRGMKNMD